MKRRGSDSGYGSGRRKRVRNYLGEAAGATLGFIVDNVGGAVIGQQVAQQLFTQEISMKDPISVINAQSKRATMKRTGHHKVKSIQGKKKNIKVSTKLRDKIKKVIEEKKAPGTYIKTTTGTVGCTASDSSSADSYIGTVNGVANQIRVIPVYNDITGLGGNQVTWWQSLNAHTTGATMVDGYDMIFFTPYKILDAASILWNRKAMAQDATITTGNFSTQLDSANLNPKTTPLRANIHVRNAYVTFEIKNNSQRPMTLYIRNCVPKTKFVENGPLQAFQAGVYRDLAIPSGETNGPLVPYAEGSNPNLARYFNDPNLPWSLIDNYKRNWQHETITLYINPGETCRHSLQGPKNMTVNFNDLYKDGNYNIDKFYKKTSAAVVIGVLPDLEFATVLSGERVNQSGRWIHTSSTTLDKRVIHPISIEMKEHFELSMPEQTGFVFPTEKGAGVTQQLQLRMKKYASFFSGYNPAEADMVIPGFNEENPAAQINI